MVNTPRYDRIGQGYAQYRHEDPAILQRIRECLGDARTVVNVGAGAGSYEPTDLDVLAIEPSEVMVSQRPSTRAPAVRGVASAVPLRDDSVDAAMTVMSLHHWDGEQERGVRELCRVARDRVVLLTYDARVSGQLWLMAEYLPEVAALDLAIFPAPEVIAGWLGANVRIEPLLLSRHTPDWMLGLLLGPPGAGARCRGSRGDVRLRTHAERRGGACGGGGRARSGGWHLGRTTRRAAPARRVRRRPALDRCGARCRLKQCAGRVAAII